MTAYPYPTLRLKLSVPQSLKLRFLPAIPGANASAAVTGPGGPGTSTDNAVTRWNGSDGNAIQNSNVILDDAGIMLFPLATKVVFGFNLSDTKGLGDFGNYLQIWGGPSYGGGGGQILMGNNIDPTTLIFGDIVRIMSLSAAVASFFAGGGMIFHGMGAGRLQAGSTGIVTSNFAEPAVPLIDGATVSVDAAAGNVFDLVTVGNRTILAPNNPPVDANRAQKMIIRHRASGGNRTLSLTGGVAGFRFGSTITGLTATVSGTTDYIGSIYNQAFSTWDVVAYAKGII